MMVAVSTVQECFAVLDNGDGFPGEMIAGVGTEGEQEDGESVDQDSPVD